MVYGSKPLSSCFGSSCFEGWRIQSGRMARIIITRRQLRDSTSFL
jgi:hypothetical protein